MNFPFYIAKRYLASKKSHNIINVITGVSVAGVTIGAMALIVVLSVFNGFEKVVSSLFDTFNPDIKITVSKGKTFSSKDLDSSVLASAEGVLHYVEVVEENALLRNKNRQHLATLKGVSPSFEEVGALDTMIVRGTMRLQRGRANYAVMGYGVAYYLDVDMNTLENAVSVYVPGSETSSVMLHQAFNAEKISPAGIFSIQQELDTKYVFVPLRFARDLSGYNDDELTSVELYLERGADAEQVIQEVKAICGEGYTVRDRYQQEALLYKIMKSEKLAIYLILTFILIIATFNVIGSLSIIMIDKKQDISFLWNMGADKQMIKRIFYFEGVLISLIGATAGLFLGFVVGWLQQTFGLIQLNTTGSFVIQAYPVRMQAIDFLLVFGTVMITGFLATIYPVNQIAKNYFADKYFIYKK